MGKGKNGFLGIFKVDDSDQDYDEEDMDMFDDDYDDEDSDESAFSGIGTFFANKKKEKEKEKEAVKKTAPNNFTPKIAESPKKETKSSFAPKTTSSYNSTGVYQNPVTGNTVQTRKPMVKTSKSFNNDDNLVSMNNQRRSGSPMNEVFVIRPLAFDDAQTVSDFLKQGKTIIINMEGVEIDSAQRIIDFIGGACYGLGGDLEAISANIFIAAPNSIEITGDLRSEIINGALSPSLKK